MLSRQTKFLSVITQRFTLENSLYLKNYRRLFFSRRFAELIISSALVFVGQQFLFDSEFIAMIWPVTGVGLSALFLRGNFLLLGLFLGSFFSYYYNQFPLSVGLSLSLLFTVTLYLQRALSLKWIGPITPLAEMSIFLRFFFLLAFLSIFYICGLFWLLSLYYPQFAVNPIKILIAELSYLNGILCLTPLCLIFDPFTSKSYFHTFQGWQLFAILLILCHFTMTLPLPTWYILSAGPVLFFMLLLFANTYKQIPTCSVLLGIAVIYLGNTWELSDSAFLWVCFWLTLTALVSVALATKRTKAR